MLNPSSGDCMTWKADRGDLYVGKRRATKTILQGGNIVHISSIGLLNRHAIAAGPVAVGQLCPPLATRNGGSDSFAPSQARNDGL